MPQASRAGRNVRKPAQFRRLWLAATRPLRMISVCGVGDRGDRMHGEYKMPVGKLVVVDLQVRDGRIAQIQVSGDFFLEPYSALAAINVALSGQSISADQATLAAAGRNLARATRCRIGRAHDGTRRTHRPRLAARAWLARSSQHSHAGHCAGRQRHALRGILPCPCQR